MGPSGEVLLKNLSTHLAPTDQVAINLLFEVSNVSYNFNTCIIMHLKNLLIIKKLNICTCTLIFSLFRVVLVVKLQKQ